MNLPSIPRGRSLSLFKPPISLSCSDLTLQRAAFRTELGCSDRTPSRHTVIGMRHALCWEDARPHRPGSSYRIQQLPSSETILPANK